jgi:hypothetical protein
VDEQLELNFDCEENSDQTAMKAQQDLEVKLQELMNENVVLRQEIEVVKQKARAMLVEKDQDIHKLKGRDITMQVNSGNSTQD